MPILPSGSTLGGGFVITPEGNTISVAATGATVVGNGSVPLQGQVENNGDDDNNQGPEGGSGSSNDKTQKGTNIPKVKKAIEIGQEAHRQLELEGMDEWTPEQKIELPDGTKVRKDGVNKNNPNKVRIIKPNTSSGLRSAKHRSNLMNKNGYETQMDFYDPNDPRFQPNSSSYIGPKNGGTQE